MLGFTRAFKATFGSEGGFKWTDDPDDPGGQTFAGISRRWHSEWPGWKIIDSIAPEHNETIDRHDVAELVHGFYKSDIWDRMRGDDLLRIDEDVAVELFDCAFHHGVPKGIKILQRALNILNRDQRLFSDLLVDGVIGGKTFAAVQRLKQSKDIDALIKAMRLVRGAMIVELLEQNPEREKFTRGWIDRIIITAAKRGEERQNRDGA